MQIKSWMIIPCASLAILACDVEEAAIEDQNSAFEDSSASTVLTTYAAPADDKAVRQNFCDHADRVLRAEALRSQREADGDRARDRERALLDGLRAGEAVFAGAERLLVRGADEVHVGFEDGWLVATAPGVDAPLARLRLANGVKVHVLAHDVRKLVLTESLGRADIAHLIVLTDLDGAVTLDVEGAPSCLVIDGGGDAATGPLVVKRTIDEITAGPNPSKATIHGTYGNDHISGSEGGDTIYGYFGADSIYGFGGVDSLYGNEDPDHVYMGNGVPGYTEVIYGGKGDDYLYGSSAAGYCSGDEGLDMAWNCTWTVNSGNPFPAQ